MKTSGRIESVIGWLLLGTFLTFVFYLPVWFAFGALVYGPIHPDYWSEATADHIFPIAAALASFAVLGTKSLTSRRLRP